MQLGKGHFAGAVRGTGHLLWSAPFTEPYLDSFGPFGDVIVSMLATIAAQDLIKIPENTKAALAKKKAASVQLGAPTKSEEVYAG